MKSKQEIVNRLTVLYKQREKMVGNKTYKGDLDTLIEMLEWVLLEDEK